MDHMSAQVMLREADVLGRAMDHKLGRPGELRGQGRVARLGWEAWASASRTFDWLLFGGKLAGDPRMRPYDKI